MKKFRKGDDVVVLTGRDKGKRGTILRVLDDKRVLVDSVNVVKKHTRPNPNKGETGGIIEKESPIRLSNLGMYITERIKNLDKYNCYDDRNNTDAGHIFNIFNTIRLTHMFRFFNNVDNESSHAECAKTESKESHLLCVP